MTTGTLIRQLENQRSRLKKLLLGYGVAQLLMRALILCAALFILDYLMEPPREFRIALTVLALGYLGYVTFRYLVHPLSRRITCAEIAAAVEHKFPELDGALVSAYQFQTMDRANLGDVSTPLLDAAIDAGSKKADQLRWETLFDTRIIRKLALIAATLVILTGGYAFMQPDLTKIWLNRMMGAGVHWPRSTTLLIRLEGMGENAKLLTDPNPYGPQAVLMARGMSLPIRVEVEGRDPESVTVISEGDSAGRILSQTTRRNNGEFWYRFRNVRENMRFWVRGGDDQGAGREVHVEVIVTPQVQSVNSEYTFPEYLGMATETRDSTQIEGPEGTMVDACFTLSKPVVTASLELRTMGNPQTATLKPDPEDPLKYHHRFQLEESGSYRLDLVDENGFSNVDAPLHPLIVKKDGEPRVKLYTPGRSETDICPEGIVLFRAAAEDDYGVTGMSLNYRSAGNETWEVHPFSDEEIDAPFGSKMITAGHVMDLNLSTFQVKETVRRLDPGDVVLYTIAARDGRPVDEEARTETGQNLLNIVSANEKIRILTELQIRLKEEYASLRDVQAERLKKTEAALEDLEETRLSEQELVSFEIDQNRLTQRYNEALKELAHVFDGYLFNRIDRTSAASALLERAVALHLASDVLVTFDASLYARLVEIHKNGEIGELDLLERLLVMIDLAHILSERLSPDASQYLSKALVAVSESDVPALLGQNAEAQRMILETLDLLLLKMDEWEDYQELLQHFRDVIDYQHNLNIMTREELRDGI